MSSQRRLSQNRHLFTMAVMLLLLMSSRLAAEPLSLGSQGRAVEDLQRTLNERLKPSPRLAVDGSFGPNTQRAVRRFQQRHKLPTSGIVDDATLKALGPLVHQSPAVPAPEAVNREALEKIAADALDGVPFVTCKAWVIADARTGKILANAEGSRPLDMASTTKIMTAHLVLQLASEAPAVLEETVTFSERADKTGGSTAGIRAGEQLKVAELLYGLMLPSGNDASVALAEHFGLRLTGGETEDPLDGFVAAMNRRAKELGMRDTGFANPHGLTAEGHHASAIDLARLAHASLQLPLFDKYVSTRQRGATLVDADDNRRNVVWRNTNRLLRIDGYAGIKTGTTSAAGACLVSLAHRGDRSLLMVVLGSSSSDARYVDSRNLYRWAWNELVARPARRR